MAKIKVTIIENIADRRTIVEVSDDIPMDRLIPALVAKMGHPVIDKDGKSIYYELYHEATKKHIAFDDTLASAGIKENDVLIFPAIVTALYPIDTFRDIQLLDAVLNNKNLLIRGKDRVLFAIILYTDQDVALSNYIRSNLMDLFWMSHWKDNRCVYFVIEKPSSEWLLATKQHLEKMTREYFDVVWERLGFDSFKPYDKNQAYKIGNYFGVKPNQFPCIVFFSSLEQGDALIIELDRYINGSGGTNLEYTRFFRMLFSFVQESVEVSVADSLVELSRKMKKAEKFNRNTENVSSSRIEIIKLSSSLIDILGTIAKLFLP